MSIYDDIRNGKYKPKSSYPVFCEENEEKRRKRSIYNKELADLNYQFYLDLCEHLGVDNNLWSKKVFDRAWSEGHSSGLSEVVIHFEELLEFLSSLNDLDPVYVHFHLKKTKS